MKIPKKITPDRIKDSIIEVRYTSTVPFEAIIGIFYQSMPEDYSYTNRPLGKQQLPMMPREMTLSFGGVNLFHNDKIKVQLMPYSIVFNCVDGYIGWDSFKIEIKRVLERFLKSVQVDSFSRIGIRYVSEYPNHDLMNCVNFSFSFGMTDRKSDTYSFRTEFKIENYRAILNLNNKLLVVREANKPLEPISIIDLDLISEQPIQSDLNMLLYNFDEIHKIEKEIFFNLLKKEFLDTLNPEY